MQAQGRVFQPMHRMRAQGTAGLQQGRQFHQLFSNSGLLRHTLHESLMIASLVMAAVNLIRQHLYAQGILRLKRSLILTLRSHSRHRV